jgi:hypothetical protein
MGVEGSLAPNRTLMLSALKVTFGHVNPPLSANQRR